VRYFGVVVLGVLLVQGCAQPPRDDTRSGSERERDSVLGASRLPGAGGVRGALRVADSAAARNTRIDSAGQP
jgi:hypothetical protein